MIKDLVMKNRSYRRFYESEEISREILLELIDLARLSPCGANRQSLKYYVSTNDSNTCNKNAEIFSCLKWAGYLKDWDGPEEGERPSAYIVVLNDKSISPDADINCGIACQSILLGAAEKGLGGCMFGSVDRSKLSEIISLPDGLDILLVIALGKPKELVVIEDVGSDGDIKYWRDSEQVHHVPKRSLKEIII